MSMATGDQDTVRKLAAWDHELATTGRVTLHPSRGKMALVLLGALAFAAVGLAMLLTPDAGWAVRIAGALAVAFFGVIGIPSLVRQYVHAGSPVVIDAAGVHIPRQVDLPWAEICSVGVFEVSRTRLVAFAVDDAFMQAWQAERSRATRLLTAANQRLIGGDAFYLPGTLHVDAGALAQWIATEIDRRTALSRA